ncbi:MAG: GNAT family N-acetyltransferase [Candidatus Bathyarchaeia archaeon]|jgi:FemAB-related protein (PEP-CTERM system-associated)
MSFSIENLEPEDRNQWDEFVESHPYGTPYHMWGYGEALSMTYHYQRYYLVGKIDGKIIGVFPLIHVNSKLFGSKLLSLPFCEYGGPLIDMHANSVRGINQKFLDEVSSIASDLGVNYVELRNVSIDSSFLSQANYTQLNRYVDFKLDLSQGTEKLWRSLDKKTRNSTRKSQKSNMVINEVQDEKMLRRYFSLYLKVEKKHGSPPQSFKLFENLLKHSHNLKSLIAEYNRIPIAGITVFYSKNQVYWWNGVSDPAFSNVNATNLLLWQVIEDGSKNGYSFMNFGRTRKDTGVYQFKKGWCGTEVSLKDSVFFLNNNKELADPEQGKYPFLSKMWSFLPTICAEKLGPKIVSGIGL